MAGRVGEAFDALAFRWRPCRIMAQGETWGNDDVCMSHTGPSDMSAIAEDHSAFVDEVRP